MSHDQQQHPFISFYLYRSWQRHSVVLPTHCQRQSRLSCLLVAGICNSLVHPDCSQAVKVSITLSGTRPTSHEKKQFSNYAYSPAAEVS